MSEGKVLTGISRATFIVGLVVAVVSSSLISTLVAMQFAKGPKGDTGPAGPQGIQGPQGPSAIPFEVKYLGSNSASTSSETWQDLDNMWLSITVDRSSSLLIIFSARIDGWSTSYSTYIYLRALVDGAVADPPFISVLRVDPGVNTEEMVHSWTFWETVSSGTHNVKIQWEVGPTASATYWDPHLIVVALPT